MPVLARRALARRMGMVEILRVAQRIVDVARRMMLPVAEFGGAAQHLGQHAVAALRQDAAAFQDLRARGGHRRQLGAIQPGDIEHRPELTPCPLYLPASPALASAQRRASSVQPTSSRIASCSAVLKASTMAGT